MRAALEAQRIRDVQSPVIPIVGDLVRANPGTISLGQGIVRYPPPPAALERLAAAASNHAAYGYSSFAGLPELREMLRRKVGDENGIETGERADVVVTAGGNMAFLAAVLAMADVGDEVILPAPYYFNHRMAVEIAGCRPVAVETDAAYQLRTDRIEEALTDRTRVVVTVSPNNPTGAVYSEADLTAVNALCRDRGIVHVSDEAYEYFTYGRSTHFSPASVRGSCDHTISLFSFSKAYGMAGARVGYMVIPHSLYDGVRKILDTMLICPPIPSQLAAIGALSVGRAYAGRFLAELDDVRQLVVRKLRSLGDVVSVPEATGAFYVFVNIFRQVDEMDLVRALVEEHGVAVIPGSAFGATKTLSLRVAYGALDKQTVSTAMDRLVRGLTDLLTT